MRSWRKLLYEFMGRDCRKSNQFQDLKIYIKDHVLFIHLNSSVVRNELLMLREELRKKLNEKAGAEVIREIVLR